MLLSGFLKNLTFLCDESQSYFYSSFQETFSIRLSGGEHIFYSYIAHHINKLVCMSVVFSMFSVYEQSIIARPTYATSSTSINVARII